MNGQRGGIGGAVLDAEPRPPVEPLLDVF